MPKEDSNTRCFNGNYYFEQMQIMLGKYRAHWADDVSHGLTCIDDLPAEETTYHRMCSQYFMSPWNLNFDVLSIIKDGAPPTKRERPFGEEEDTKATLRTL